MKNRGFVLNVMGMMSFFVLLFFSCNKNPNVDIHSVKVIEDPITPKTLSVTINGRYSYPSQLKGIAIYVSKSEDMKEAIRKEATINKYSFSVTVDGLEGETRYYYYYEFNNGIDVAQSEDIKNFKTADFRIPKVELLDITDITATSAIAKFRILDDGDLELDKVGVCWTTNQSNDPTYNPNGTNFSYGSLGSDGTYVSSLSGLNIGGTYYVLAFATNGKGVGYSREPEKLVLKNGEIEVSFLSSNSPDVASIECQAKVEDDGGDPITSKGFCWSMENHTPNINSANCSHSSNGSGVGAFQFTIAGLRRNTTYYIRAYATNSKGTFYSTPVEQPTMSGLPSITTGEKYHIGADSLIIRNNRIMKGDLGGLTVEKYGICWSSNLSQEHPSYWGNHTEEGSGLSNGFASVMQPLAPNREYSVCAYAVNNMGDICYGDTVHVKTKTGIPSIYNKSIDAGTTEVTFTCSASDGGSAIIERGICWGDTPNPGFSDHVVLADLGNGVGDFTVTVSGLNPGNTYHFRSYAKNQYNSGFSPDKELNMYYGHPIISSLRVIQITDQKAVVNAWIESDNVNIVDKRICCDMGGATTDVGYSGGSGSGSVWYELSNLQQNSEYHLRIKIIYNGNQEYYSEPVTFKTSKEKGALNGVFSVSATKKVCFSRSNLFYRNFDGGNLKFGLETSQLTYLGNNGNGGQQTAERDLFGWGTSGYNHGAVSYQPWALGPTVNDNKNFWAYGDKNKHLFEGEGENRGKADWGYRSLYHGGSQENFGWRTLTNEEWSYLITNCKNNGKLSVATVVVNGEAYHGLILLPNDWAAPQGITFVANASSYSTNTYDDNQWKDMEAAGAVFLPAGGRRYGSSLYSVNDQGWYWSANVFPEGDDKPYIYALFFNSSGVDGDGMKKQERRYGFSVRLVMDY